ncbi:MAG: ABC transporter substrate-binding protein [Clostridiales bacterium]|nr:ABC transporter substrate-binding protein [Clostridiales bacterium]
MKKNKIIILLLISIAGIVIMAGVLAGCGTAPGNDNGTVNATTSSSEAFSDRTVYPLTLKDAKGADVVIPASPQKIVSISLGTDEILSGLVDSSRIAALCTLSIDPGLSNIVDFASGIPVKAGTEAEKIISLGTDLVLAPDWSDEKFIQQLKDAKILVFLYTTPGGVSDVQKFIRTIAEIVDEKAKGEELVAWMDEKLAAVKSKVEGIAEADRKVGLSLDSFYYTYGTGTTFDDICNRAGVVNSAVKAGISGWMQLTKEKVVEMNPGVIFLPTWSYEGFDAKAFVDQFRNDVSLAMVKAVKDGMVLTLPENHMTSVSQYIVLGVEDVAKAVYPSQFK